MIGQIVVGTAEFNPRIAKAPLLTQVDQFSHLFAVEITGRGQNPRIDENTAICVEDFGKPVTPFEPHAIADNAMIRQHDDVGAVNEGDDRFSECAGAR